MAASLWNNAGTWEEKDCSAWAKKALQDGLLGACVEDEPIAKITQVKDVQGHAHLLHVRGTPRVGMEWTIKLKYDVDIGGESVVGNLTIVEMTETEVDDYDMEVSALSGDKTQVKTAKQAAERLRAPISKIVKEILETAIARSK